MPIGDKIRQLRELHGLTQRELGDIAGVSDKAVSTWEKGTKMPRMGALRNMAKYFGSTVSELLEEPPVKPEKEHPAVKLLSQCCLTRTPEQVATALSISPARIRQLLLGAEPTVAEESMILRFCTPPATGMGNVCPFPLPTTGSRRIPVLGRVPAGVPIEAVMDVVQEIDLSTAQDGYDYFGLLVTGDSMMPEYRDGDVVILRMQATAQTGDDVVAYIGASDATLKRLTVTENGIQLRPLNPAYDVRSFTNEEIRLLPVTIAGVVVEQRRVRRHG